MNDLVKKLNDAGERVFFDPYPLLSYYTLATGSLASNTYRGFHRIDKNQPGSKEVFDAVLINGKDDIVTHLKQIKTEGDLNKFETNLCQKISDGLRNNIVASQLASFNKVRKPIDIVIEHMVSMGEDFSDVRKAVTPQLYLPLDSQMFQSEFVFSDAEIGQLRIKRSFTFKDIESEEHYLRIQDFLRQKAERLGLKARIFFDLVWNDRYKSKGTNLLGTNPR